MSFCLATSSNNVWESHASASQVLRLASAFDLQVLHLTCVHIDFNMRCLGIVEGFLDNLSSCTRMEFKATILDNTLTIAILKIAKSSFKIRVEIQEHVHREFIFVSNQFKFRRNR